MELSLPCEYYFSYGIAGSMDENVKHLSLVVADGLTYYDVPKEQLIHCFPNQEIFKPAKELVDLILGASDSDTHVGLIITGDDFIAEHEKKQVVKSQYPALCVDMKSTAIAHTALLHQAPFAVIRCTSDLADGSDTEDYENFERLAAKKASSILLKVLEKLEKDEVETWYEPLIKDTKHIS